MSCKLFSYDKSNGNWVERGRGTLRLNDMTQDGQVHSRVIMRTTGSLRVILNTKVIQMNSSKLQSNCFALLIFFIYFRSGVVWL